MLLNNLYTIKFKSDSKVIVELSNEEHPIFKAHFPNNPILPGFVHFDIVSNTFNIHLTTIKKAKFIKIALPSQILIYEKNNNKFTVSCDNQEIASFSL